MPPLEPAALRTTVAYAAAVALPLATCLALVPLRDHIDRSTAGLVLVLPVLAIALISGPGAAAVAAVSAALFFDLLLTRPYHRLEIHAAEDVEAAVVLLVVGVAVGQLVARNLTSRTQAVARRRALEALLRVLSITSRPVPEDELVAGTAATLSHLLDLRECRWAADYHGSARPVIGRTGGLEEEHAATSDGPHLPEMGAELPAIHDGRELGRFIVVPARRRPISREERSVAIAIADVFARALAEQRRP